MKAKFLREHKRGQTIEFEERSLAFERVEITAVCGEFSAGMVAYETESDMARAKRELTKRISQLQKRAQQRQLKGE
jgi:hypothetical protein